MKNLVKAGIFAFAIALFATACTSTGTKGENATDSIPAVEQEAPAATTPATDSVTAPLDTAAAAVDTATK